MPSACSKKQLRQELYPSGVVQARGQSVEQSDGTVLLVGPWTYFYENGRKMAVGEYHNGRANWIRTGRGVLRDGRHGQWTAWYNTGQKESQGACKFGQPVDVWQTWYKNGQIQSEANYVARKERHGISTEWHDNGQVKSKGAYREGKRHGVWTVWYRNGQKCREGEYTSGEKHGAWTAWHENGTKSNEGHFDQGELVGQWRTFEDRGNETGNLIFAEARRENGIVVRSRSPAHRRLACDVHREPCLDESVKRGGVGGYSRSRSLAQMQDKFPGSNIVQTLEKKIDGGGDVRVLEFGTGEGRVLMELRALFSGIELHGANKERWQVMYCQESFAGTALHYEVMTADELRKAQLPIPYFFDASDGRLSMFGDGTFDLVISQVSARYVLRVDVVLQEFYRILKPGGVALTTIGAIYLEKYGHEISLESYSQRFSGSGFDFSIQPSPSGFHFVSMKKSSAAPLPLNLEFLAEKSGGQDRFGGIESFFRIR